MGAAGDWAVPLNWNAVWAGLEDTYTHAHTDINKDTGSCVAFGPSVVNRLRSEKLARVFTAAQAVRRHIERKQQQQREGQDQKVEEDECYVLLHIMAAAAAEASASNAYTLLDDMFPQASLKPLLYLCRV